MRLPWPTCFDALSMTASGLASTQRHSESPPIRREPTALGEHIPDLDPLSVATQVCGRTLCDCHGPPASMRPMTANGLAPTQRHSESLPIRRHPTARGEHIPDLDPLSVAAWLCGGRLCDCHAQKRSESLSNERHPEQLGEHIPDLDPFGMSAQLCESTLCDWHYSSTNI